MADDKMTFNFNVRFNFKFQDANDVRKYFREHERLKAYELGVHTKYAERLEYGCGPLKYVPGEDYDELCETLKDWARVKFNLSKADADVMGKSIADRFWENGVQPHYFYRPAIAWLISNKQQLFDEGYSIGDICHMAEQRIRDEIVRQNLIFKGTMLQSISCRPLDDKELISNTTQKISMEDMKEAQNKVKW